MAEVPKLNDVRDVAQKLEAYAELEGSELGELCLRMTDLSQYSYMMSDELAIILFQEMTDQLKWFKENTKVVTETITETRDITTLEFLDE